MLADLLEPEEADPAKRLEVAKRVIDHVKRENLHSPSLSVNRKSQTGETMFVVNVGGRAEFGQPGHTRPYYGPTLTLALDQVMKS